MTRAGCPGTSCLFLHFVDLESWIANALNVGMCAAIVAGTAPMPNRWPDGQFGFRDSENWKHILYQWFLILFFLPLSPLFSLSLCLLSPSLPPSLSLQSNNNMKPKEGEVTSQPWQWPLNYQGQVFSGGDHRVYLLGNPVSSLNLRFLHRNWYWELGLWCVYLVGYWVRAYSGLWSPQCGFSGWGCIIGDRREQWVDGFVVSSVDLVGEGWGAIQVGGKGTSVITN